MGKKDNNKDKIKIDIEPINIYQKVAIIKEINQSRNNHKNDSYKEYNESNNKYDHKDDNMMIDDILLKKPILSKKKQNIPICEVSDDPQYDSLISDDYIIDNSYLRTNRRIDDENDVILEYIADEDDCIWLKSLHTKKQFDVSILNDLSLFESIINLLERNTSYAKDPISLMSAEKLIAAKLSSIQLSLITSIFPDIYNYWIGKREKLQKPLCRKFWPQTLSSDTNPHHVFRARDKERYRLRKQHRRNDIESFRKMHHLRREFEKAQLLLNYVLEREKLREAEFEIQQEIFDQTLYDNYDLSLYQLTDDNHIHVNGVINSSKTQNDSIDMDIDIAESKEDQSINNHKSHKRRKDKIYKYIPTYLDISQIQELDNTINNKSLLHNIITNDKKSKNNHTFNNTINNESIDLNNNSIRSNDETLSNLPDDININIDKLYDKKKKSNTSNKRRKTKYNFNQLSSSIQSIDPLNDLEKKVGVLIHIPKTTNIVDIPTAANIANINNYLQEVTKQPLLPNTSNDNITIGKLGSWIGEQPPTFMNELNIREQIPPTMSFTDYIKDLEFRDNTIIPNHYRCRGRLGRGGRLMIDRIPIYDKPYNSNDNNRSNSYPTSSKSVYLSTDHKYIQPTTLPTYPKFYLPNQMVKRTYNKHAMNHNGITIIDGNVFYNGIYSNTINNNLGIGYSTQIPISLPLQSSLSTSMTTSMLNDTNNQSNDQSSYQSNYPSTINFCLPLTNTIDNGSYKPLSLLKRSKDIYNQSDSEDEIIDYVNPYILHNVSSQFGSDNNNSSTQEEKNIDYKVNL